MQLRGRSFRRPKSGWYFLVAAAGFGAIQTVQAQVCAGLPSRRFSLLGAATTSSEEQSLAISPGVSVGPAFGRFSASSIAPRHGLGSDSRYGVSFLSGGTTSVWSAIQVCPGVGVQWTRRDGARATEVQAGLSASLRLRLQGALSSSLRPLLLAEIHRERVKFDSVSLAGEDYSQYNYSDVFAVFGMGLSMLKEGWALRGLLAIPAGTVAQHPTIRIEAALGIGAKRHRR
jgi:hypothetical protein